MKKHKKSKKKYWKRIRCSIRYAVSLILFLFTPLQTHDSSSREGITFSFKDASLDKVLRKMHKQTGYSFVYPQSKSLRAKKVTIQVHNSSLDDVLALCFKDQPLTYTIVGKVVIIKPQREKVVVISVANIIQGPQKRSRNVER